MTPGKAIGGLLTAIGGVCTAIAFIWGSIIGYYPSQAGALIGFAIAGVLGLVIGGLIWKGSGRPELPAGAVLMSADAPRAVPLRVETAAHEDALDAEIREARDPATAPARLAELARSSSIVQAAVAGNPSTYPALLTWLGALDDPAVDAVLAGRGETTTPGGESLLAEASDPATSPARLADLARRHPELRPAIAANPSAYDGLRGWIAENP